MIEKIIEIIVTAVSSALANRMLNREKWEFKKIWIDSIDSNKNCNIVINITNK